MTSAFDQEEREAMSSLFAAAGYDSETCEATMDAERDVMGTRTAVAASSSSSIPPVKDDRMAEAMKGMQEALDQIAHKPAYDQALRRNPKVVQLETPFRRFLLANGFNYWAAADQLVQYWQQRWDIFGEERYCRPMTIAHPEESALSAEAIAFLESGGVSIPWTQDKYGRVILLTDLEANVPASFAKNEDNIRVKLIFYLLQVLSESDSAVTNGVILVTALKNKSSRMAAPGAATRYMESSAIPAKACAFHYVSNTEASFAEQHLFGWWRIVLQGLKRTQSRMRVHFSESTDEIHDSLQPFGIHHETLPMRLGGNVDLLQFAAQRAAVEAVRYWPEAPPTIAAAVPKAPSPDDRAVREKRKMHHFRKWADHHLAKHKAGRLKKQIGKLRQEHTRLSERETMGKAQITCATHVVERYERDHSLVLQCLSQIVLSMPGRTADMMKVATQKDQVKMTESVFEKYLIFLGKAPITGEWLFQFKPGLSREQQLFAHKIQACLLDKLNDLGHCQPEWQTQKEEESAKDQQDEEDIEIVHLQKRIKLMKEEQTTAQKEHEFLSASLVMATQMSTAYTEYRQAQIAFLAEFYDGELLSHPIRLFLREQWAYHQFAQSLADLILGQYTMFNGTEFENPLVNGLRSSCTTTAGVARLQALRVIEPIVASALGRPIQSTTTSSSSSEPQAPHSTVSSANTTNNRFQNSSAQATSTSTQHHETTSEQVSQEEKERLARRQKYRMERKKGLLRL